MQPFEQDDWLHREAQADGWVACRAYDAARQMNLSLFRNPTDAERAKVFHHPERGEVHVEWMLEVLAGHERHHLVHFEIVAAQGPVNGLLLHGRCSDRPHKPIRRQTLTPSSSHRL